MNGTSKRALPIIRVDITGSGKVAYGAGSYEWTDPHALLLNSELTPERARAFASALRDAADAADNSERMDGSRWTRDEVRRITDRLNPTLPDAVEAAAIAAAERSANGADDLPPVLDPRD